MLGVFLSMEKLNYSSPCWMTSGDHDSGPRGGMILHIGFQQERRRCLFMAVDLFKTLYRDVFVDPSLSLEIGVRGPIPHVPICVPMTMRDSVRTPCVPLISVTPRPPGRPSASCAPHLTLVQPDAPSPHAHFLFLWLCCSVWCYSRLIPHGYARTHRYCCA